MSILQLFNKIRHLETKGDKAIWSIVIFLSIMSIMAIYSTLANGVTTHPEIYLAKQIFLMLIGFFCLYIFHKPRYTLYARYANIFLVISIVLLLLTFFFGTSINGEKRWLFFSFLRFQPSDVAKIALVIFTARYLNLESDITNFKYGIL